MAEVLARTDEFYQDHHRTLPFGIATGLVEEFALAAANRESGVGVSLAELAWRMIMLAPAGSTSLRFRNVHGDPQGPVELWPQEGLTTALERGHLPDWRRIAEAAGRDADVAEGLRQAVAVAERSESKAVGSLILDRAVEVGAAERRARLDEVIDEIVTKWRGVLDRLGGEDHR